MSYAQGWGILYSTPVASGGYNIARGTMNQVLNDITTAIQNWQQNSIPPFITTTMNGGTPYTYPQYAQVLYNGVAYQSLVAGNADTPPTSKWAIINPFSGLALNAITGTNHAFVSTDSSTYMTRSNSTTAMVDTLPGTTGALANGNYGYIKNTDASASLTVTVGSGGTIYQGNLTGSAIILPGELWFWESEGAGSYNLSRVSSAVLHAAPTGGNAINFSAIVTSTTAGTLTANEIVLEDTNGNTRRIKNFSASYATGTTGAGGIDTGTIAANTWYYEYALFNPTTGAQAAMISLSATSPTLPSGYTYAKATGEVLTDGSAHLIGKEQKGQIVRYKVGVNLAGLPQMASGAAGNTSTPTWVSLTTSSYTPPTAWAIELLGVQGQGAGTGGQIIAAPNNSYGGETSATNPPPLSLGCNTTQSFNVPVVLNLETANTIYYAIGTISGGGTCINCVGWRTNLMN